MLTRQSVGIYFQGLKEMKPPENPNISLPPLDVRTSRKFSLDYASWGRPNSA